MDIGYNIADKNYGAVVYSKNLFREQCRLHLNARISLEWADYASQQEAVIPELVTEERHA